MSFNPVIDKSYNFEVWPAAELGSAFKNATVLAVMNAKQAAREMDIVSAHIAAFPYLPSGTPDSPTGYNYVKIQTQSGDTTILGLPWIKENTVIEVTATTMTIVIGGPNLQASDLARVRAVQVANGWQVLALNVNEV